LGLITRFIKEREKTMKNEILCFVKFGERQYMESLANGEFYFSNAKRFAEIEEELVKGQGDKYEGKAHIDVTHMKATDHRTGEIFETKVGNLVTMGVEKVKFKPIYCLSAFTKQDCNNHYSAANYSIQFSKEMQNTIMKHFPKADTAVVFFDPPSVIKSLQATSKSRLKYGFVNYLNMHPVGVEWIEFVNDKEKIENGTKYTMTVQNAYKMLFCKDLYFKEEKEYRFVFADDEILTPKVIYAEKLGEIKVIDIGQLFDYGITKSNMEIKLSPNNNLRRR
jgi:hypothetical protein